jgi:hypothetical protein
MNIPTPPEGYRLLTDDEKTKCLNDDTMFFHPHWMTWKPSIYAGCFLPKTCYPDHFATRAPLPAEQQVSQIADAREGQVASRVIPDSLKIGAPQHEQAGESLPSATTEPSASESSGDAHLRQAREESERLSRKLTFLQDKFDQQRAALAAAHTKALAQEGLIEKLKARDETASRLIERINEIFGDDVIVDVGHIVDLPEYEAWETASALATPSSAPAAGKSIDEQIGDKARKLVSEGGGDALRAALDAPVAGKTNPPEISSAVVDGGEKDSAVPTPRTAQWTASDSRPYPSPEHTQIIQFEGASCVVMAPEDYEALFRHAEATERELAASESLYQELIYQVGHKYEGETRHQTALRYLKRAEEPSTICAVKETPPVAEGGEG